MSRSTTAALLADTATPLTAATASAMEGRNASGAWSSLVAISRSLATAALAAAIVLALAATAPAQNTWAPGGDSDDLGYVAVTLNAASSEALSLPTYNGSGAGSGGWGLELWVNLAAGSDLGLAEINATGGNGAISLSTTWDPLANGGAGGHKIGMVARDASFGQKPVLTSGEVVTPGVWTHIAGTIDTNGYQVLVNGVPTVGTESWSGLQNFVSMDANFLGRTTLTGGDLFLDGMASGLRVWAGQTAVNANLPTTANSYVTYDFGGSTPAGLDANFQLGSNGLTNALAGSPVGGTLTPNAAALAGAAYTKFSTGTLEVVDDTFFLDTIDAGTLQLGNGGTTGALTTAVVNNGTLSFNRNNTLTHGQVISGSGAVTQDGTGTTTLSVANTYSGLTSVNAGILAISNANSLGTTAAGTEVASGATLQVNGGVSGMTLAESIGLNGGTLAVAGGNNVVLDGTVTLGTGTTSTFRSVADATDITITTGSIAGDGNLVVGTSGNAVDALFLNGANTYTGTTTIAFGDVFVSADGALGTTAGGTTVDSGSILGMVNVNYATAEPLTLNGGNLDGVIGSTFAGPITLAANSTISASGANLFNVTGVISGGSDLGIGVSGSTGTVTLNNDSTYTGGTSVDFGALEVGDGGTTGSLATSGVSVASGATLQYNRSDDHTVGYAITGAGQVNITGGGVATLSVASNYTGDTNVNLGGLNIASTLTSDVILANGSTVSGSGSSTGSISGDGMVAPGNSPGILEFASLDASAGTDFSFEFTATDPDYSNATASVNDVLRLSDATTPFTTALTSSSTVNIYLNVDTLDGPYTGGFFTDVASDFIASVQDATFAYYLKDAAGAVVYNGVNYRDVSSLDWTLSTVPATATFAGGTVNGQVLQVVPEPSSFALAGAAIAGLAAAGYRRRRQAAAAKAAAQIAA